MYPPRTPRDDEVIRAWIAEGLTDFDILMRIENKKWRSEVITLAGRPHCATCLQLISLLVCLECGRAIHER